MFNRLIIQGWHMRCCAFNINKRFAQVVHQKPRSFQRKRKESRHLLLVLPALAFGLGCWQVKRWFWKQNLNNRLKERTRRDPIPLPDSLHSLEDIDEIEFIPVSVKGTFDYSKEMVIAPRHDTSEKIGYASFNPSHGISSGNMVTRYGGHIVVPFKLSDGSGRTILVNRGWVEYSYIRPETRQAGQIMGEVELVGIVRKSEPVSWMLPDSVTDPVKTGSWISRDIEEMARAAGTNPIFIDAVASSTVPGGPIGGQTIVQLRDQHVSYILTWFSLSAFSYYMYRKYVAQKAVRALRL